MNKEYEDALGVENNPIKEVEKNKKLENAFKRAHELRKFEIELYWKRASHFWAFQLVSFTFLGLLIGNVGLSNLYSVSHFIIIPCLLGCMMAIISFFSAKGSKFWHSNWEFHVDALESEFEYNLAKTILTDKELSQRSFCICDPKLNSYPYSVTQLNELAFIIFGLFWFVVFLIINFKFEFDLIHQCVANNLMPLKYFLLLVFTLVISLFFAFIFFGRRSKLDFQKEDKVYIYSRLNKYNKGMN